MTINILSQSSVDSLRMSAKRGAPILTFAYDELVEEFRLQELPLDVDFDSSVELLMPDGKKQETNNDDVNCLLISKALPSLVDIDATDESTGNIILESIKNIHSQGGLLKEKRPKIRSITGLLGRLGG